MAQTDGQTRDLKAYPPQKAVACLLHFRHALIQQGIDGGAHASQAEQICVKIAVEGALQLVARFKIHAARVACRPPIHASVQEQTHLVLPLLQARSPDDPDAEHFAEQGSVVLIELDVGKLHGSPVDGDSASARFCHGIHLPDLQ